MPLSIISNTPPVASIRSTGLLLLSLAPQLSTSLSLSDFTPRISSLPQSCNQVYRNQIANCVPSDFARGAKCSTTCAAGIRALAPTIKTACSDPMIPSQSIIGIFMSSDPITKLCPNGVSSSPPPSTPPRLVVVPSPAPNMYPSDAPTRTPPQNPPKPVSGDEQPPPPPPPSNDQSPENPPPSTDPPSNPPPSEDPPNPPPVVVVDPSSSTSTTSTTTPQPTNAPPPPPTTTLTRASSTTTARVTQNGIVVDGATAAPSRTSTATPRDSQTRGGSPFDGAKENSGRRLTLGLGGWLGVLVLVGGWIV